MARISDDGLCASEAGFLFKTSCLRTVFECTTHITTFLLDIGCKFEKKTNEIVVLYRSDIHQVFNNNGTRIIIKMSFLSGKSFNKKRYKSLKKCI